MNAIAKLVLKSDALVLIRKMLFVCFLKQTKSMCFLCSLFYILNVSKNEHVGLFLLGIDINSKDYSVLYYNGQIFVSA